MTPGPLGRWRTGATLRRLWPFVAPERRRLLVAFALAAALTAVEVSVPVAIGVLVDRLLGQLGAGGAVLSSWTERGLLAALLLAAPLRGLLLSRQRALEGEIGQRVAARIRRSVWRHVQRLPVAYTRRRGPGRLLLRFIGDSRAVQSMVGQGLVRLSQDLVVAAGILLALASLNWRMSLAVLAMVPLQALIFRRLNPRLRRDSRARRRRRSSLSAYLNSRVAGLAVAGPALGGSAEMGRFNAANRGIARRGARVAATHGRILGLSAAAAGLSGVLVLVVAAGEARAGRLTAGTMVAYLTLTGLLSPIFERVALANRYLQEGRISIDRLAELLSQPPEAPAEGGRELEVREGTLSVEELAFGYGAEPPVLRGASMEARRGEVVAVIGPSGSGKSTLLELLLRFREPDGGRILIDGRDVAGVSPGSVRARIGFVPQDVPLLDGTVAQNVAIGAGEAVPEAELERAARLAGADRLIARLPGGWGTEVAEGRRGLSHGERWRLALARALVCDPPILVIDEVGSMLDADAELAASLRGLAERKTIIIAATRLPASLRADRIYALEGGRLVEQEPVRAEQTPGASLL
ncbi:MAG: ABC transporter ATP-binding protein/permease [Chloroflexota bacterium]|nr:ABC transporter ATP-binding protein/permease [Chloroflexota bacterium]